MEHQQSVPESLTSAGEQLFPAEPAVHTENVPPQEAAASQSGSLAAGRNGGRATSSSRSVAPGTKFDLSEVELHARGQKSAPIQPPKPKKGHSNVLYIEGAASAVPFSSLDAFWRALWSIIAAVLGVERTRVIYAPAVQLDGGQLMASAHYWMSSDLVERLAEPEGWAKLELGLRMFGDSALWQNEKLEARYAGQPWMELLETIRAAWPAAGFEDTLLRCSTKPEVVHGSETAVQPGVQA